MRWTLVLCASVAMALLAPNAVADHMANYRYNPVEHDDQGRSDEPDFLRTGVLGQPVENCVVELPGGTGFLGRCTGPGVAAQPGQGAVIAPGCTGDGRDGPERRLSGQCGIVTVGLGVGSFGIGNVHLPQTVASLVGERGMAGDAAPGAFTPRKDSAIRFLDGHIMASTLVPGPVYATNQLELNRKFADLGARTGTSLPFGDNVLPGKSFLHWWYGEWRDRNGNGVIDHHTPGSAGGTINEFAWLGNCMEPVIGERNPEVVQRGLCIEDGNQNADPPGVPCAEPMSLEPCAKTEVAVWVYPGNHHAFYPAGTFLGVPIALTPVPGDFPAQQPLLWLAVACFGYPGGCDEYDAIYGGDPLFGQQSVQAPDIQGSDATGREIDTGRHWAAGGGYNIHFYDDGLLITMVQVYGVNCAHRDDLGARYDLATCTFTDVDRQVAVNPLVEQLLVGSDDAPNGGLKGALRSTWLLVRDF